MVTRTVFLGTPEFAVPALQELTAAKDVEVVGVITQPDRPSGRGRKLTAPPVKQAAGRLKIPVYQFGRIRKNPEARELLDRLRPDVAVVVAFGQILPADFFDRPPLGTLNVHASILPYYRGAAPICHAILQGEEETGVTIMKIDAGMDTGAILSIQRTPIPRDMTTGELEVVLASQGAKLLVETLRRYVRGEVKPVPQDDRKASYAPMISRKDGRIDWSRSGEAVHNRIRAMNPWPVAECLWRQQTLKVWRSQPLGSSSGSPPGTIVAVSGGIQVACGGGSTVELLEVQAPGRRQVAARDFANGMHLAAGEMLS